MPMTVRWHPDERYIILWEVGERFTVDEFYQAYATIRTMLDGSQVSSYYIVTDLSRVRHYPSGLVSAFRQGHRRAGQAYRGTIMVGAPTFARSLISLLQQLNIGDGLYRFANSVEDAVALIKKGDLQ